jgi:transcriptional regulator with GAF, ATPase, and Fis domain
MGLPLVVNRQLIGAMTADALAADVFEKLDRPLIQVLSVFAAAELHTTRLIEALENKSEKMCQVSRLLVQDARELKDGELIDGPVGSSGWGRWDFGRIPLVPCSPMSGRATFASLKM